MDTKTILIGALVVATIIALVYYLRPVSKPTSNQTVSGIVPIIPPTQLAQSMPTTTSAPVDASVLTPTTTVSDITGSNSSLSTSISKVDVPTNSDLNTTLTLPATITPAPITPAPITPVATTVVPTTTTSAIVPITTILPATTVSPTTVASTTAVASTTTVAPTTTVSPITVVSSPTTTVSPSTAVSSPATTTATTTAATTTTSITSAITNAVTAVVAAIIPKISTAEECEKAGANYRIYYSKTTPRPIQIGSWAQLNPGCSVQTGGDWATHWNTYSAGSDIYNKYTSVPYSFLNSAGISNATDCEKAGINYRIYYNKTTPRPIQIGSWPQLNPGCSVQTGGDWATHWNNNSTGSDIYNRYTTVLPSFINSAGISNATDCEKAGINYRIYSNKTTPRPIQIGSWPQVGPGCSVQSGGDWATHWNNNSAGSDIYNKYTTVLPSFINWTAPK